jgi:D-glycero-D-manno-heptose 1,7-bisphosphate phosphatase
MCPHHPRATVDRYRVDCECRKPKPGLLIRAALELDLDLRESIVVGDRASDVAAGALAGCRTVLVRSGAHQAPPIETTLRLKEEIEPDHVCADLVEASKWILGRE